MRLQSFLKLDTRIPSANMRALFIASLALAAVAQDRTTEQGEAAISNGTQECTPYYYAASASQISKFPTIWTPATILSSDTAAQAKWNNISGSIPTNILPRGTNLGNFTNVTYDTANDPACFVEYGEFEALYSHPIVADDLEPFEERFAPSPNPSAAINIYSDRRLYDVGWTVHQCTTPKLSGLSPDVSSVPEPKTMGYGFDDGPNCTHNAFYDYLQSQNQKATMFFIGSNVMDWPLEAQRALADGHEICVRMKTHGHIAIDAFAELYYTMQAIKLVTGVTPTCWRPPFGDVDDRIRAIANALGLQTIIWKFDSNDWRNGVGGVTPQDVDNNYMAFINNASTGKFDTQGGIMLTHELNNFTMSEAVKFYPQLKSAFSYLVPVGVALNKTQPYVETNYSLPTFEQYIAGTISTNGSSNSSSSGSASQSKKNAGVATVSMPHAYWAFLGGVGLLMGLAL
ncbi:hypothetical protein EW146_g4923 [Bondarzewia mesenterica]|uniref:chitin deacetylase n=1 Tax=Bondarzewia mesenterica TaxID=1095465 RepID=A0A4S4LT17_9AGAM|nr:hypothetical protein EW146_g4923 [Bondarzewia mesenterica]